MLLQADRAIDGFVFGRAKLALAYLAALVTSTGIGQCAGAQQAADDVGADTVEALFT